MLSFFLTAYKIIRYKMVAPNHSKAIMDKTKDFVINVRFVQSKKNIGDN